MRRFSFAFACVILSTYFIAPSRGMAQNKQASSEWSFAICLKEVHFEANRNGNFSVYTDLPGYSAYEAPHFVKEYPNGCIPNADGNIVARKPVAYVSGNRPRVKAVFLTDCPQELYFKAVGPEINGQEFELEWTRAVRADTGVIDLDFKRASVSFENNKVQYFDSLTLHWQYSLDNSNWVDIDSSTHPLYVTYDWPNLDTVHHTLLDIGCKSANGGSDKATIVDDIYNIGFDRKAGVHRADGAGPIAYWTGPNCQNTREMLINLTGACGGWAAFFTDVLLAQGIDYFDIEQVEVTYHKGYWLDAADKEKLDQDRMIFFDSQYMDVTYLEPLINVPAPAGSVNSQFYVKKWGVSADGVFTQNEYVNKLFGNIPVDTMPIVLDNGKTIEVTEQNGVPGQGNDDPRSEFENHALVKYNNKYYDPSYGSPIRNSQNEWETEALSFFGSVVEFRDKNDNDRRWFLNWVGHLNDTTTQTNFYHYR